MEKNQENICNEFIGYSENDLDYDFEYNIPIYRPSA